MEKQGKLYLIPVPISEGRLETIPASVLNTMHALRYFIVERARTARRWMRESGFNGDISQISYVELDNRSKDQITASILQPVFEGHDMGLMSEAGIPAIADPGTEIVRLAHKLGIQVVPLTGPGSLFLALAASGLNGQQFCFHGYLPVKKDQLRKKLQELEQSVWKHGISQIFIETPYRNEQIFRTILEVINPAVKLCIARDITGPLEMIHTYPVSEWKKKTMGELGKYPVVFILGK
ncbi:MAG TPA: SAM-dependent methyltransferase [Saprospirales bacterium]|nr:SAM-dependent methyltransferase [Saprospirales bacterium]HRQ29098.1 SAM-dependent methyltransferase [Saprospiraceae bacterium]